MIWSSQGLYDVVIPLHGKALRNDLLAHHHLGRRHQDAVLHVDEQIQVEGEILVDIVDANVVEHFSRVVEQRRQETRQLGQLQLLLALLALLGFVRMLNRRLAAGTNL